MDAATERPTLIQILSKCAEYGRGTEKARSRFPARPQFRSLSRAGETREILKTRLARDLPLLPRRASAERDIIFYSAGTDDLYMYKVTFTILKTVLAGRKQLFTFLHL